MYDEKILGSVTIQTWYSIAAFALMPNKVYELILIKANQDLFEYYSCS